jgi:hypothetical protein
VGVLTRPGSRRAVVALLCASAAGVSPAAEPVPDLGPLQALCFTHVGPEDKPMPSFCVAAPGAPVGADHAATEQVELTPPGWQTLIIALQGSRPPDPRQAAAFGRYQVLSQPPAWDRLVTPQFMRQLVLIVQQDAQSAGRAVPAPIERLSRRLPV